MRDGVCPECGAAAIHAKRNGMKFGEEGALVFTSGPVTRPTPLDFYVCINCGYFESCLADAARLEQIARSWPQVG